MNVATKVMHAVLITGAGQGLGACIARQLHAAGFRVAITDIDMEAAKALAAELSVDETSAVALELNVCCKADFERALALLVKRWGSVQVLVNNAALTRATPVMDISAEEFDQVIGVNLRGCFFGCQVFGQHFRSQGYGRIVNIGSLAGQNGGTATGAHYAVSKGAVITLTKVFARELAAAGVTVNAVAPGPLNLPVVYRTVPRERFDKFLRDIPVGMLGEPEFVAQTIVQLVSPAAAFVTGATWDLNGGLYLR